MKPFMTPIRQPEKLFGFRFMCWNTEHAAYGKTMEEAYILWKYGHYINEDGRSIVYDKHAKTQTKPS